MNSRIWQTVTTKVTFGKMSFVLIKDRTEGENGKSDIEAIDIFCIFSELCIAYSREGMKVLFLLITSCHRIISH